jgi:hypothetical protein
MSNIEFENDQFQSQFKSRAVFGQPQTPGMAAWLVRKGIIKDEASASKILNGVVIFNFVLAAFLIYYFVL